jgi:hypothetical protein
MQGVEGALTLINLRHTLKPTMTSGFDGYSGLDRQIDASVYDLYVLTPAEIKIVEGATK